MIWSVEAWDSLAVRTRHSEAGRAARRWTAPQSYSEPTDASPVLATEDSLHFRACISGIRTHASWPAGIRRWAAGAVYCADYDDIRKLALRSVQRVFRDRPSRFRTNTLGSHLFVPLLHSLMRGLQRSGLHRLFSDCRPTPSNSHQSTSDICFISMFARSVPHEA